MNFANGGLHGAQPPKAIFDDANTTRKQKYTVHDHKENILNRWQSLIFEVCTWKYNFMSTRYKLSTRSNGHIRQTHGLGRCSQRIRWQSLRPIFPTNEREIILILSWKKIPNICLRVIMFTIILDKQTIIMTNDYKCHPTWFQIFFTQIK